MENGLLPFLSRKQLNFQEATAFGIRIISRSATTANLAIRGFTKEGQFSFLHTTLATNAEKTETFNVPDVPIMFTIDDPTVSAAQGLCYVRVELTLNGSSIYSLGSSYINGARGLSWPLSKQETSEQTKGLIAIATSADPAAGAELSFTVAAGTSYKLLAIRFSLVTAAVAASRRVHIVLTVDAIKVLDTFGTTDQIISETKVYSCFPMAGLTASSNGDDILIPIPKDLILTPGSIITTETTNLDGGDDFSVMQLFVERSIF